MEIKKVNINSNKVQHYLLLPFLMCILFGCLSMSKIVFKEYNNAINPKKSDTLVCGIDISHYQGEEIDYLNNKSDQLTFVICKATEGVTVIDPDFNTNWAMIKERNIIRGAYHFYHCTDDPTQQASFFLSTLGTLSKTDFPPIVDFEENSIDKNCNKTEIQKNLLQFLTILEQKTGRKPILYSDTNTANAQITEPVFANYCLWIADYNSGTTPQVPSVWKNKNWSIWQKSPNYSIETYTNDYDIFNGNKIGFTKFIQGN
jgi:lysozyme